jgi:hypothetical protein
MSAQENTKRPPTLDEAKENLAWALELASPASMIKSSPLRSVALAALTGAILGASRTARRSLASAADLALSFLMTR